MNQLSFDYIAVEKIKLDGPFFFIDKKVENGHIFQIAYNKKNSVFSAIYQQGSTYHISSDDYIFESELEKIPEGFKVKGCVKNINQNGKSFFEDFKINGSGLDNQTLRPAQSGAVYNLMGHWSLSNEAATVVLPTGTGKTETMLVATLADRARKTLVIVPSIELKNQIADKFSTWGMLRELGVISESTPNPVVFILDKILTNESCINDIEIADVIVSTPSLIARANKKIKDGLKEFFSHVYFDEAHHIKADEWDHIKNLFKQSKIVQFTATPYRNDKKPIEGEVVYNYPLSKALADGCFSKISLVSIDERNPSKKDEVIARAAMDRLIEDRNRGWVRHRMMVRTETAPRAELLFTKYKEWFPNERIVMVHSRTKGRGKIVEEIKRGSYDIIICVDMLKEGFDYPEFKIAAVHDLHKSMSVLLQFIGRFTRTQKDLGDASFIVNYAEESMSTELENLFQEGAGWEMVISEIADARKAEAESLLTFLQGCKPYGGFDSPEIELNPKLVYPALSCVCYECEQVDWSKFKDSFNLDRYAITQPYFNQKENVFYFTTQKREKVKWARTDKMRDQTWNLIVMHYDLTTKLLYIGYSEKRLDVNSLVENLSSNIPNMLNGDCVFRSFDSIKRLSIIHAGIFKPANHLHRYSRLSGADVTTELTRWKEGKRCQKSDFVGVGYRDGFPVSVGASVKGKIWSPARVGDLKGWKAWCLEVGKLITDETIDSNQLLEDSAEKIQLDKYPEGLIVLATDWAEELYSRIHKLTISLSSYKSIMLSECTLKNILIQDNKADFELNLPEKIINFSIVLGGEHGHSVIALVDIDIMIDGLKSEPISLKKFFEENPPTLFLMDGCTISGCIQTDYGSTELVQIPKNQIEAFIWDNVDYTIESLYKKGEKREKSVQEYMMKYLVEKGAKIVFNDDNAGESADIVAIFQANELIKFELVHCKYSKGKSGLRLEDLYEVCGQAIVSLRYKWKPEELLKHLERRNGNGILKGLRFYHGNETDLDGIKKGLKYSNVEFEFTIAQPGVKANNLTKDMEGFLASIYSTVIEMTETKLKCYFNQN
ncbi:helicase [Chryseobacterium sp. IHB B 17019]|uniref:DEAD/DEAH box helicase n=1 Tax=Chryseobacterium sp. IHB B 17019 TaxID=1721091 RepID=UPI00071EAC7C|nr:DEAD/DEAH box helicase family protein [Chryseobacterium sp. IHB B 17019]ALR30374.1 helicase [Chryseobacterium sp. IHB B 17019]